MNTLDEWREEQELDNEGNCMMDCPECGDEIDIYDCNLDISGMVIMCPECSGNIGMLDY